MTWNMYTYKNQDLNAQLPTSFKRNDPHTTKRFKGLKLFFFFFKMWLMSCAFDA